GKPTPELFSLSGFGGMLELVGGALLVFGLFTQPVAFLLSGEMAVAYWMGHAPRGFFPVLNGGDAAILYCFIFLYIAFAGGGAWSLDRAIWKRIENLAGDFRAKNPAGPRARSRRSIESYCPFFLSQPCIRAISLSCALTISSASFLTSGSLPKASTVFAMSTAPA